MAAIIGLAIAALTLGAAIAAALFAKKAADHTGTGANAAQSAVNETRRIGEAQVRCYLTITKLSAVVRKGTATLVAQVQNSGQSPARIEKGFYRVGALTPNLGSPSMGKPIEFNCKARVPANTREFDLPMWTIPLSLGSTVMFAVSVKLDAFDVFDQPADTHHAFCALTEGWKEGQTYEVFPAIDMANAIAGEKIRRDQQKGEEGA